MNLIGNRSQADVSAFIILLYALYGAYIASLFTLGGSKGSLPSADFLLFSIVCLLFGLTNFSKLLVTTTFNVSQKSILVLFFVYVLLKLIIDGGDSQMLNFMDVVKYMGENFIAGFIAFAVLRSRTPIISKLTTRLQNQKRMRWVVVGGTLISFVTTVYLITEFTGTSLLDMFLFTSLTNEYYQTFGDYLSIAYCCLMSLQVSYLKGKIYQGRWMIIFILLILVQLILAGVCLQIVRSNKSVVLIALVSVLAIYYCKPKDWFISNGRVQVSVVVGISLFLLSVGLILTQLVEHLDVSKFRLFDYGASNFLLDNSSLQLRWQQVVDSGMEQFSMAPFFGNLSITDYLHSSVLSVQTHLGFVGSLLLWAFTITQLLNIYGQSGNEGLKTISLPILFVSAISSFFTWAPLWFLMGAMYGRASVKSR